MSYQSASHDDEIYIPNFDLGEFRHLAARYCRHLIRARCKSEPEFLDTGALNRWQLSNIQERETLTVEKLLRLAACDLDRLNREFLPRCSSGGLEQTRNEPVGRLITTLTFLVPTAGAGPAFNATLLELAQQAAQNQPIEWASVFDANELSSIRNDLDRLPHPGHDWSAIPDLIDAYRLVVVDGSGRREAYWERREINAEWDRSDRAWKLLVQIARRARHPRRYANKPDESIDKRGARDDLAKMLPDQLYCRIESRNGVFRLDLPENDVRVFHYSTQEYLEEF